MAASEQFASDNVVHGATDSRKQREVPAALTSTRVRRNEKSGPTAGEKSGPTAGEKSGPTAGEKSGPTAGENKADPARR